MLANDGRGRPAERVRVLPQLRVLRLLGPLATATQRRAAAAGRSPSRPRERHDPAGGAAAGRGRVWRQL